MYRVQGFRVQGLDSVYVGFARGSGLRGCSYLAFSDWRFEGLGMLSLEIETPWKMDYKKLTIGIVE